MKGDPPFITPAACLAGSFAEIEPDQWNALLREQLAPTPVVTHEFLSALESTGCTNGETGWQPLPLSISDAKGQLLGAAPVYAKGHSYGEYVFDWAWADAYQRAGLDYYPKLLIASPFSPIPGTRLLAKDRAIETKRSLLHAVQEQCLQSKLSSVHVLFPDAEDLQALREANWLIRENVQFHWHNLGYSTFEDYLNSLTQPKRKKIKAERRKVREAGVSTRMLAGPEITEQDLVFFYRCYERTYREHHSTPYLSLSFFQALLQRMPKNLLLCVAERQGEPIAASFFLHADRVLYGRYWGALARVDCLHFEVAYYAPIAWAIAQGIVRFEGGAQGEHKLARGFTPVKTYSGHWLREPAFYDAVARYLERESRGIEAYVNELEARTPLRG